MSNLDPSSTPPPDEAFMALVGQPGMEDLAHSSEILETPTPWDAALNPHETDGGKRGELETQLRDTINDDDNPAVKGQVWQFALEAISHDKRTGDGQSAALALQLLDKYPDPGDLIREVIEPSDASLVAMPGSEKADLVNFYTYGPGKNIDRAAVHRAQLDDEVRHAANERVLQILYGDRYEVWKQANATAPDRYEVFEEPIEVEHAPVDAKELAHDEAQELDADQPPLIDRETMRQEFGIDGQLLAVVNVGDDYENVSVGVIDIRGTGNRNDFTRLNHVNNPFLDEQDPRGGFEAEYIMMLMEDGEFVGRGAGIRYNETVQLKRGHGTSEKPEFSALQALLQNEGRKMPDTVSRKHAEILLTKDGRVIIRNFKPTNRTVLETAKKSTR